MLATLIFFMTVITGICNQIGIFELLGFFGCQIFYILLPGIALMILMPISKLREIEKVLLAYTLGYILTMVVYALVMVAGGRRFLKIVFVLMAIWAIGIILLKEYKIIKQSVQSNEKAEETNDKKWILSILIVFFASLIVFSLRWKAPYTGGKNYYEADFLYWVKDIVALKRKVPPIHFWTMNEDYRYHYFGALQQAVISSIMDISAIKVAICYSYIEGAVFFGLSSYTLIDRMIKKNIAKIVALLFIIFATGYEIEIAYTYIWHIRLVPMSYDIAQSLGLVVILLLLVQLEKEKIYVNDFIVLLLCLLCCTGTKTATGAVIAAGVFVVYLYWFLSRKEKKTAIILVSSLTIIFGILGLYFWPRALNYNIAIQLPRITDYSMEGILDFVYTIVVWLLRYISFFAILNIWTFIPAAGFIIYSAIRKSIKKEHIVLFVIMLIGTAASYVIRFYGNSHIYFAFMAFPLAAILTGCLIDKIFSRNIVMSKQLLLTGITGLMCAVVLAFSVTCDYKGYFYKYFVMGLGNLSTPNVQEEGDRVFQVSYAECQAYEWLRENTDEESLILSDRALEDIHNPISVFAERYVYWFKGDEDMECVEACFSGDDTMLEQYAGIGIDYVVQTKRLSPKFYCPENLGELVFDNDEVAVYKLF